MISTVILTLITITNPTYAYKLQDITYERVVLSSAIEHDAENICRRIGEGFVKNTPIYKDKYGSRKYARIYTCQGGSQLEFYLDEGTEKKVTK